MMKRVLQRDEIETVWTIDRSEVIRNIYVVREGKLVLAPSYFEVPGWPPGEREHTTAHLYKCVDRGGTARGIFDGDSLVGVAVTDGVLVGENHDRIQLYWLHVSRDYRARGIGAELFEDARAHARALGAAYLYVSATPTENTVRFYLARGCELAAPPDPELLAAEPEDVHLLCTV